MHSANKKKSQKTANHGLESNRSESKMMEKWLQAAKPIFFLSLGFFFLSSGGLMIRFAWMEDPFRFLGRRLLEKDAKLLVDILSNPRTVGAIRAIALPAPSGKEGKPLGEYIVDQVLKEEGAWIRGFAQKLLEQPPIQKLAQEALRSLQSPSASTDTSDATKQSAYLLGRYLIDRIMQDDAKPLRALLQETLLQLQKGGLFAALASPPTATVSTSPSTGVSAKDPKAGAQASEKEKAPAASLSPSEAAQLAMVERLGRYTVDQLLAGRAQKLRSILLALVGPELMRLFQDGRLTLKQLQDQTSELRLRDLVQDAAFAAGRGALETFLRKQQEEKQQEARLRRQVERLLPVTQAALRKAMPCLIPAEAAWLRWQDKALQIRLIRAESEACKAFTCEKAQSEAHAWFLKQLQALSLHRDDLRLQIGSCQSFSPSKKE